MNHLWHGFADMNTVKNSEVVIVRGEGPWVWDEDGRRYLDAIASLWYCNIGHGRAELVEAARGQLDTLAAYQIFGRFANRPAIELAERLSELAPQENAAVFFTNGGSDAVDTAAKLVRRYWNVTGRPERKIIVAREHSYHGMNAYGTTLTGLTFLKDGYGELVGDVVHVGQDDTEGLAQLFATRGHEIAAFFAEPVIGGGGVIPPPEGYWETVGRLCREHDVLLVADEVITGFGRLGTWFGSERFGITPDVITCAKGLTSGYFPLGAVLCGARVREPFWNDSGVFWHAYTYGGHPTACAVGLKSLEVLESEGLVGRVGELEPLLAESLRSLERHPLVGEVRAIGLMAGVELANDVVASDPRAVEQIVASALERGVIVRALVGRTIQISPPFIVSKQELSLLAQTLEEALDDYAAS